jgi:malonyl-CoA/methylmalonyl-CoA synthetase
VRSESATVLFGVPTSYQALLDSARGTGDTLPPDAVPSDTTPPDGLLPDARPPGAAPPDGARPGAAPLLGGLRLAVCGSAPLSPALAAQLPGLLGQLPLVRYGTTESGLDVSHPLGDARADSVGLPLPGVECRIWSADGAAAPGSDGEIQLRGPQVFAGYWHDPEATAAAFTPDGWFRTGDIGAVDPLSGHLVIRGRIKELIITGGLNVYPREVEIALESHPTVAEAAVAAVPHQRWGEQVTAWVVVRPGCAFAEGDLVTHARTLLAPYKCPKRVFQLAEVPRNQLGKVNRTALAAHVPDA